MWALMPRELVEVQQLVRQQLVGRHSGRASHKASHIRLSSKPHESNAPRVGVCAHKAAQGKRKVVEHSACGKKGERTAISAIDKNHH